MASDLNNHEAHTVVSKLILYCHKAGEELKLLKYLTHAKKCFSSHGVQFGILLRKKGALKALQEKLLVSINSENEGVTNGQRDLLEKIYVTALNLLKNVFSVDYRARVEVVNF